MPLETLWHILQEIVVWVYNSKNQEFISKNQNESMVGFLEKKEESSQFYKIEEVQSPHFNANKAYSSKHIQQSSCQCFTRLF